MKTARKRCPGWCDYSESAPHSGRHAHHVGEVMLSQGGDDRPYCVAVTIESYDKSPRPYLAVAQGHGSLPYALAAMSWAEADALAGLLSDARKRYA